MPTVLTCKSCGDNLSISDHLQGRSLGNTRDTQTLPHWLLWVHLVPASIAGNSSLALFSFAYFPLAPSEKWKKKIYKKLSNLKLHVKHLFHVEQWKPLSPTCKQSWNSQTRPLQHVCIKATSSQCKC